MAYTAQDFKKGQPRWCPGCGDHFFLANLQKAMAEIGVDPWNTAVISGIGCSSRLPHYMATYGMNTIHGRAAAIATGCKVANPRLTVWQISGDGDGLAIGGNHFIHANRRNIDLNMILLNNRIYGLTKGQYSPTSPRGFVSKSSPYGTVEDPFRPAELCFGARGHFFARAVATDAPGTIEILKAAYNHREPAYAKSCRTVSSSIMALTTPFTPLEHVPRMQSTSSMENLSSLATSSNTDWCKTVSR